VEGILETVRQALTLIGFLDSKEEQISLSLLLLILLSDERILQTLLEHHHLELEGKLGAPQHL